MYYAAGMHVWPGRESLRQSKMFAPWPFCTWNSDIRSTARTAWPSTKSACRYPYTKFSWDSAVVLGPSR